MTESDVWDAYRALHRYIQTRPHAEPVKLIRSLPKNPPPPSKETCHIILSRILSLDKSYPLPYSPVYYAYLYLFVQCLRCSHSHNPSYTPGDGWSNLAWFPLRALIGIKDTGENAWVFWYKRHFQGKRPTQADMELLFPFLPEPGVRSGKTIASQVREFRRRVSEHGILALDGDWHPFLFLAEVSTWRSTLAAECLPFLTELIDFPDGWNAFIQHAAPKTTEARRELLSVIDSVMQQAAPAHRVRWRRARRKLL